MQRAAQREEMQELVWSKDVWMGYEVRLEELWWLQGMLAHKHHKVKECTSTNTATLLSG